MKCRVRPGIKNASIKKAVYEPRSILPYLDQLIMSCFKNFQLSKRRGIAIQIASDVIGIIIVACGYIAIKFGTEPYHRGFFCDDESIKHPVLPDTISDTMAAAVGLLVPIVVICVSEFILRDNQQVCLFSPKWSLRRKKTSWLFSLYRNVVVFIFGMGVTQVLTEMGKNTIGRLRPHFLTLCNPDFSQIQCDARKYITENVCTSNDTAALKEARLSFPSGHSSFSMYCMLYAILYLQYRVTCSKVLFLKPVTQLVLFCMTFYTCLSRISDYKHHPGDVVGGALLGLIVCIVTVFGLTDFGKVARQGNSFTQTKILKNAADLDTLHSCDSPTSQSYTGHFNDNSCSQIQVDL